MGDIFKDKQEVREYLTNLGIEYRFSCFSEKNAEGCQLLGDYFTQITKETEKANKVFKENCDVRNFGRSCTSYGISLLKARGVAQNYPLALEYFSKACEVNDATGCDYAGKLLVNCDDPATKHITIDPPRGIRYLERGCNLESTAQLLESTESCAAAAIVYGEADPTVYGIPKDEDKAIQYGTKSCDRGHMKACRFTYELFLRQGKEALAEQYKRKFAILKNQESETTVIEMQRS